MGLRVRVGVEVGVRVRISALAHEVLGEAP